jgi:hypothetical protein
MLLNQNLKTIEFKITEVLMPFHIGED